MSKPHIHFGSLEETIKIQKPVTIKKQKTKTLDELESENHINISQEQQQLLDEFDRKKRAKQIAVPTEDSKVRSRLRDMAEPMTLFGEGPAERRDRLRHLMSLRVIEEDEFSQESDSSESEEEEIREEFYTIGSDELLTSRKSIVHPSLKDAKNRIHDQKQLFNLQDDTKKRIRKDWFKTLNSFSTYSSQFGDERPLSVCSFSPNSKLLATGSWGGGVKLWDIPSCNPVKAFKAHRDRISSIDFHPFSTTSQSSDSLNMATSGSDGSVLLWSLKDDSPIGSLEGHEMRVCKALFHPSGNFIATSSFDQTWRLWDVETRKELLIQEGHSKEVFALGFQSDGSLIATGGMDSIGRIWDLRIGRSIMILKGHVKSLISLDWSPNGHQLATGSEDNSIRIWDIRNPGKYGASYTIPAHNNLVSQIKYFTPSLDFTTSCFMPFPTETDNFNDTSMDFQDDDSTKRLVLSGSYLVSSSYDGTCKIWSQGDWKLIKSLNGLEGKITSCDVSGDGKFISTAAYDRTFRLHGSEMLVQ